jgi:hypothetical protein
VNALEARVGRSARPWPRLGLGLPRDTRRRATGLLAATLLTAAACASPEPPAKPPEPPSIDDTVATERLSIDGMWHASGEPDRWVQIDRGRIYVQEGFEPAASYGEVLFADIHQSGPRTFRCRAVRKRAEAVSWRTCELELRGDGGLVARKPGAPDDDSVLARFEPIMLADDIWYQAQLEAWYILSATEAHHPEPQVVPTPIAPLPDAQPTRPKEPATKPPVASPFGDYHALVIGAGDYTYLPEVATAVGDADAVSTILRDRYGFQVTNLRNPTLAELNRAVRRAATTLREQDNLLVYFAGRGALSDELGRCYWFPADATGDNPGEGISNEDLAAAMRDLRARRAIVIADSCFTASEARSVTLDPAPAAATVPKQRARVVLTSGGSEPIQDGSGSAHSVFTGAVLQALRANGETFDGTALFEQVKRIATGGTSQSPEFANIRGTGHEGGDFVFVPQR